MRASLLSLIASIICCLDSPPALAASKKSPGDEAVFEWLKGFSSLEAFNKNLGVILKQTRQILANPLQFRREIVIILGIAVVAMLFVLTAIVMVSMIRQRAESRRIVSDIRVKRSLASKVRAAVIISVLAIFLTVGYYTMVTTPAFCGACHQIEPSYKSWVGARHKNVTCIQCHSEPGLSGFLLSQLNGFDNLLRTKPSAQVNLKIGLSNAACLRCHGGIYRRTSIGAVSVRHKELIDAQIRCTDCHKEIAHGKEQRVFAMDRCVICHDGKRASSDCQLCHKRDIATIRGAKLADFPKVREAGARCYSVCHKQETLNMCTNCHGVIMPHPPYFLGIHASAANKRPILCNRCHPGSNSSQQRCGCHLEGEIHGQYQTWFPDHGKYFSSSGASCNCHKNEFCERCHEWDSVRNNY